jgi:hypothetical protein
MGFDIFIQRCRNGERAMFKRELVQEIFGRYAVDPPPHFQGATYLDGRAEIFGADEGDEIDGLMCSHFSGMTFYEALYELADRTGSVIFWPSDGPWAAVTKEATLAHSPPGAFDRDGRPPSVVGSARELVALISGPD